MPASRASRPGGRRGPGPAGGREGRPEGRAPRGTPQPGPRRGGSWRFGPGVQGWGDAEKGFSRRSRKEPSQQRGTERTAPRFTLHDRVLDAGETERELGVSNAKEWVGGCRPQQPEREGL